MDAETQHTTQTTPADAARCVLRVDSVRFRYGAIGPWVLDINELVLHSREQVLLTGPSGCGKSTLLQLIAGLMEPSEGRIEVAGQDVHGLGSGARDAFRGRTIGMVFQTLNLLPGFTAIENVLLAMMFSAKPKREHGERAADLLGSLGLERVNAPVDSMSLGQQQRVAVARALACEPALVLADEPTASLDPDNARNAIELLQRACEDHNAALLCVSHDPALLSCFDRIESYTSLHASGEAHP
ncbi:MAG: ABC transporter ATP-binding protein [Phycisphaeraceae bacterium]|nr:ABC transporter ATP-binding protein [Phycisphaerales bacterium]MCB9861700.1 ABC transporter ATP-binding protein [Phycisphaeraceae bacterium]